MMADKPVLFSGPMVRALLAGTKTQTRRALNPQPDEMVERQVPQQLRISIGDRLYVREHWRSWRWNDDLAPRDMPKEWGAAPLDYISYIADNDNRMDGRFRQGMHMPRWASRLTLTVTDVRVERLQDISEADALAEGIIHPWNKRYPFGLQLDGDAYCLGHTAAQAYRALWNTINGPGAWGANPWVAAYTFAVQMGNIDQLAQAA